MNWYICEKMKDEYLNHTAGIKARDDLDVIFDRNGMKPIILYVDNESREKGNAIKKFLSHIALKNYWLRKLENVKSEDTVFLQFPVRNHSIFLSQVVKKLSKRNIKTVLFIHDLEYMRHMQNKDSSIKRKQRIRLEEVSVIKSASYIVVHNSKMKTIIRDLFEISDDRLVELQIFDYLIGDGVKQYDPLKEEKYSCIIAGNLDKNKSSYVYDLPRNVEFELYGPNYSGDSSETIHYHGSYPPEELPYELKGSFGLVWDGTSSETCEGVYGEYLKVNNPHKTSLYLASGIPVIIWKQAALAEFVEKNKVGVTIDSLKDLDRVFEKISRDEYKAMLEATKKISEKLKSGYYTMEAIKKC